MMGCQVHELRHIHIEPVDLDAMMQSCIINKEYTIVQCQKICHIIGLWDELCHGCKFDDLIIIHMRPASWVLSL